MEGILFSNPPNLSLGLEEMEWHKNYKWPTQGGNYGRISPEDVITGGLALVRTRPGSPHISILWEYLRTSMALYSSYTTRQHTGRPPHSYLTVRFPVSGTTSLGW